MYTTQRAKLFINSPTNLPFTTVRSNPLLSLKMNQIGSATSGGTLTEENLKAVAKEVKNDDDDDDSSGKGSDNGSDNSSDKGSDDTSDTDSTTSSEDNKGFTMRKAVKRAGKVGKEFKKLFINYGPPYRKYRGPNDIATALLQDNLLNECCKPEAYLSDIHR